MADPVRRPFHYVGGHLTAVEGGIGERPAQFLVDTGIGPVLLDERLLAEVGATATGQTGRGRRMSGQSIEYELWSIPELEFGDIAPQATLAAPIDLRGFAADIPGLDGILSLAFFAERPVTFDPGTSEVVFETDDSLAARASAASVVPLELEGGPAVFTAFLRLRLPDGTVARVEVDSGSDGLILHSRYRDVLGLPEGAPGVRTLTGRDETGQSYSRAFGTLSGSIAPETAPELAQVEPAVMFQEIIYDGLIGKQFLGQFSSTFDVPRRRLLLGPPGTDPGPGVPP